MNKASFYNLIIIVAVSWNFLSYFLVASQLFLISQLFLTYFTKIYHLFPIFWLFSSYFSSIFHFSHLFLNYLLISNLFLIFLTFSIISLLFHNLCFDCFLHIQVICCLISAGLLDS